MARLQHDAVRPLAACGAVFCARRGQPFDQRHLRRVRARTAAGVQGEPKRGDGDLQLCAVDGRDRRTRGRLDPRPVRSSRADGGRHDRGGSGHGQRLAGGCPVASVRRSRPCHGLRRLRCLGRPQRFPDQPLVPTAAHGRCAGRRLVGVGSGRHCDVPACPPSHRAVRLAPRLPDPLADQRRLRPVAAGPALAPHRAWRGQRGAPESRR